LAFIYVADTEEESSDCSVMQKLLDMGYSKLEFEMQDEVGKETQRLSVLDFAIMYSSKDIVRILIQHVENSAGPDIIAAIRNSSGFLPLHKVPAKIESWEYLHEKIKSMDPNVVLDCDNARQLSVLQAIHTRSFRRYDDVVRLCKRIMEDCPDAAKIREPRGTQSLFSSALSFHTHFWLNTSDKYPSLEKIDTSKASPILQTLLEARFASKASEDHVNSLEDLGIVRDHGEHLFGLFVMLPRVFDKVYQTATDRDRGKFLHLLLHYYMSIKQHHRIIHELLDLGASLKDDSLQVLAKFQRMCPEQFWDLFWRLIDEFRLPFVNPLASDTKLGLVSILCCSPERHLRRFIGHLSELNVLHTLIYLSQVCKLINSGQIQFEEGVPPFLHDIERVLDSVVPAAALQLPSTQGGFIFGNPS
jgi:hypothetical protein